jgi:molybdopterin-containing oxidoreductase family iron-sulfur binding subunit
MNKPRTNAFNDTPALQNEDNTAFNEAIERDFGGAISDTGDGFSRRRWLQLMGASLALGSVAGCRYEEEKIATFAFRPQNRIPGIPQKYATFTELGGVAEPLLATSFDGRPIKLDGNPKHDESKGASTSFSQARILEFYDPDRLRSPMEMVDGNFAEKSFEDFVAACSLGSDLSGTAILSGPTSSASLLKMKADFEKKAGSGNWFTFSPINDDNSRAGAKLAFGENLRVHADMGADVVVTIDADPLSIDPGSVANSIDFAKARDVDSGKMNRLYAVESQFTHTGGAADHRLAVRSSDMAGFVGSLLTAIEGEATAPAKGQPYRERVFNAIVADLKAHKGKSVVVCGESQPAEVHAAVHRVNDILKNNGKTITFTKPVDADRPSSLDSIKALVDKLNAGKIKQVVILGGNPVYDAPRKLKLAEALSKAKFSAHVSYYKNETSLACSWVSAVAHPLESWKDGTTYRGSTVVGQPLINPLHGGKSILETLAALMGVNNASGQELVREAVGLDQQKWMQAVHDGFVEGSAADPVEVSLTGSPSVDASDGWSKEWNSESLELVFKPSNSVYDGRFANNAWLQELPDFFTKIAWDNVAQISPNTAKALGVTQSGMGAKSTTQVINIKLGGETVPVPIAIQPGQADGSIGLAIGSGRTAAGRVGGHASAGVDPVGHDVNALRSLENWTVASVTKGDIDSTSTRYQLAVVQEPWAIDKIARDEIQYRMFRNANKSESDRSALIREGSFESFKEFREAHPNLFKEGGHDHGHDHDHAASNPGGSTTTNAMLSASAGGALPILNQVSYTTPIEEKGKGDDHDDHDHGHGHGHKKPHWPTAFHMHHDLFDLTLGVRENYKAENPEYSNMWGKSIDLNKCIGCNSCVIACQSENNIPVVGKAEVWRGRELHWIRIDRYYGENLYTDSDPEKENDYQIAHQPVACHHCENAPCETVCPVAATVHSNEGLNDMVYNRCIGTRYCGNNCPYKVRRFNFLNYSDAETFIKYPGADKLEPADLQLQSLMMNPDVSIRSRGVMEKCTYCVQRIQNTKIQAKNEGRRPIGPNEITTACQDACPTSAIKFGDLNNLDSDVRKAHDSPRAYSMLEELNNRPRTMYLARVRNPHPGLIDFDDRDSDPHHGDHGHGSDHDHEAGDDHDHDHDKQAKSEKKADH